MTEKRYFWLKLYDDFFTSKRIKKLRSIAGGDTYTIIYLKMQLKALKDEGYLFFDRVMNDFAEELALDIDENPDDVRMTIQYLMSVGLIETNDNEAFKLTYMEKLIGSETASAQRVRDFRERQKHTKLLHCNASETDVKQVGSVEIEKEIEKEIDIDIEIDKRERTDYQRIADMYNDTCVSFPRLTSLSDARKKAIKARLNSYTVEDFAIMFQKAESSDFLKGKNERNWSATFDWMIKDSNMAKILDGNYDNKPDGRYIPEAENKFTKDLQRMADWAKED